ncbi:MAG: hypothetical protein ACRCYQ_12200 [Nocardioides sp.]
MNAIKNRHLYGAGAAACAVCCAPPLMALLGIAGVGAAATIATIAFAGIAFGAVLLGATLLGLWARTRAHHPASTIPCDTGDSGEGPIDIAIGAAPKGRQ